MAEVTAYAIRAFASIVAIGLHIIAFTYLQKLERIDCTCAFDKHFQLMKYALLILIAFFFVNMVLPMPDLTNRNASKDVALFVFGLSLATIAITYYVYTIYYINRLVREKCKCSEDLRREILYIYSILQITLFALLVLAALLAGGNILGNPVQFVKEMKNGVIRNIRNPVKAISDAPGKVRRLANNLRR